MVNTFNSGNEGWTEIALSGGWIELLAGFDSLSARAQGELNAIKAFGVANNYIRPAMKARFLYWLSTYMQMEPGTTD